MLRDQFADHFEMAEFFERYVLQQVANGWVFDFRFAVVGVVAHRRPTREP
jgi:hypothetical protein